MNGADLPATLQSYTCTQDLWITALLISHQIFFCTISRYRAGTAAITDSPNTVQGLPRCGGLLLLPLDEGCMILNLKHFQNLLKPCTGFALIGSYQKLSVTDTYDLKPYFGPSRVI